MNLGLASAAILLLNLPFGYWRAHVGKFSFQWFVAVHLPIIVAISMRLLSGLGWHLVTFPALIGAYCVGQFGGGMIYGQWEKHASSPLSACLVCDLWKRFSSHGTRAL